MQLMQTQNKLICYLTKFINRNWKNTQKEVSAQLNEEEKALQTEQARIEAQLKAAEAEYESVSQRMDKNIQADAIKFA